MSDGLVLTRFPRRRNVSGRQPLSPSSIRQKGIKIDRHPTVDRNSIFDVASVGFVDNANLLGPTSRRLHPDDNDDNDDEESVIAGVAMERALKQRTFRKQE